MHGHRVSASRSTSGPSSISNRSPQWLRAYGAQLGGRRRAHVVPWRTRAAIWDDAMTLGDLRAQLEVAVRTEDFTAAARIRDTIQWVTPPAHCGAASHGRTGPSLSCSALLPCPGWAQACPPASAPPPPWLGSSPPSSAPQPDTSWASVCMCHHAHDCMNVAAAHAPRPVPRRCCGPLCRKKQSDARLAVEDANRRFYDAFAAGSIQVRIASCV